MPNSASSLTLATILWLVASSGAFGAVVHFLYSLGNFYRDDSQPAAHWKHGRFGLGAFLFVAALLTAAMVGIASAMAVLLIVIEAGRFAQTLDVQNELFLITLSVAAGFIGRHLLPNLGEGFRQQLDRIANQHAELQVEATKTSQRINAISRANTALAWPATPPAELAGAAQALAALNLPADRTVALLRGTLYRAYAERGTTAERQVRYGEAISALSNFLQAKGATRDVDYAAALYNRACYKCLRNIDQDLPQALDDLRVSVGINAHNKALARQDADFDHVRRDPSLGPQFEQLVAV